MARRTKRRRTKRRAPDPKVLEQRAQKKSARTLFRKCGFQRIGVEDIHFTFKNRTGELDDLFVFKNVLVIVEYTVTGDPSAHLLGKKVLFDQINGHPVDWIDEFRAICPELSSHLDANPYSPAQYQVRIIYCTKNAPSEEAQAACKYVLLLGPREIRYFIALTKTISLSSRAELYKFLKLDSRRIADRVLRAASDSKDFSGFLLPESFSSFPRGFRLASFYADPETLLETCFVLRKDSWRDPESLYQRMLMPKKIRNMRRYLSDNSRVFINNIIVSLPSEAVLLDPSDRSKVLTDALLHDIQPVTIQLPQKFNSVGVIDGQHRIFCYHEGEDVYEEKVSPLRKKQHLLVTGVIYPASLPEEKRRKFEAQLFLEINDEQTKTRSDLKQSIALLLRPTSTVAICKAIVNRLAEKGPLKDLLEIHFFDDKNKLKTASIVSYGLKPLVKFEGTDTLFKLWKHEQKEGLRTSKKTNYPADALKSYIEFCASKISDLLLAAKLSIGPDNWKSQADGGLLSPTLVNGFIVCLRELVTHRKSTSGSFYASSLKGLNTFPFKDYKSSHWRRLGLKIAETHFAIRHPPK